MVLKIGDMDDHVILDNLERVRIIRDKYFIDKDKILYRKKDNKDVLVKAPYDYYEFYGKYIPEDSWEEKTLTRQDFSINSKVTRVRLVFACPHKSDFADAYVIHYNTIASVCDDLGNIIENI